MKGMLLAAGYGTRFAPFTDKVPKPCIPLLNVPIAFYNLHVLQQMGLDDLTVNTHHLPNQVVELFSKSGAIDIPVHFNHEADKILGTGGGILAARKHLAGKGTFIVGNADVVNGFNIRDVLNFHHRSHAMATLIVMQHPDAGKKYGAVWVGKNHQVVAFGKTKPDHDCKPYHYVGVQLMEESVFKYIPQGPCDIFREAFIPAINEGELVTAKLKRGFWFDCGNLEDFLFATKSLLALLPQLQHQPYLLSLYRRFWKNFEKRPSIWEGVGCEHSLQLSDEAMILLDDQCQIHPSVQIKGFAVVGANTIIEKNVTLENVVIGRNQRVQANQNLSNTLII